MSEIKPITNLENSLFFKDISNGNTQLRNIPNEELNAIINQYLVPWIKGLLSLSGENSAERLILAIPTIKELCTGMTFLQVKKMFEMYAHSKMELTPIANYFDIILVGKIVSEYRKHSPKKPVAKIKTMNEISQKEKDAIDNKILEDSEKYFKENGKVDWHRWYAYDILEKRGLISLSLEEKKEIKKIAIKNCIERLREKTSASRDEHRAIKSEIRKLEKGIGTKIECKLIALHEYYKQNTRIKGN